VAIINNNTLKKTIIPRERQTQPDLIAFYDIWPGIRMGLFLQPLEPTRGSLDGGYDVLTTTVLFRKCCEIYNVIKIFTQKYHMVYSKAHVSPFH